GGAAAAGVVRAYEENRFGRPSRVGDNDISSWWQRMDLEHDAWVYERGDELVAFGGCDLHGPIGLVSGVVRPSHEGRGLGTEIVERCERRLVEKDARRFHAPVPAADEAAVRLFSERGYSEVRRFWDMAIELHEPPDVPELPAPLVLEPYRDDDARPFHAAMIE